MVAWEKVVWVGVVVVIVGQVVLVVKVPGLMAMMMDFGLEGCCCQVVCGAPPSFDFHLWMIMRSS